MAQPLTGFWSRLNIDFINDVEGRLNEYLEYLEIIHPTSAAKKKDGKTITMFSDDGYNVIKEVDHSGVYVIECYDKMERTARYNIENDIKDLDSFLKRSLYIKPLLAELKIVKKKIEDASVNEKRLEPYKQTILEKLNLFYSLLVESYSIDRENDPSTDQEVPKPKIKWLHNTNVLVTLFDDLLNGYQDAKKPKLKPLIDCQKADIKRLILNNFLDKEGKPISPSTIDTLFKPGKNALAKNKRIRLDYL